VGQFCSRVAAHNGARVIAVDLVTERLEMARRHGIEVVDARTVDDVPAVLREMTQGRGPDAVIDAVGMEAHGAPFAALAQRVTAALPDAVAAPLAQKAGVDRLTSLLASIEAVRRGGTVSIIGVYGGALDPMPMMQMFDKGIQLRMGQAHVKRWIPDILPLVEDDADPLGVEDLTTHRLPLEQAPRGYEIFQKKEDGCIKVVLTP
jgi:threonine dehydrogenase-like Zn-dependent dehydrogenase